MTMSSGTLATELANLIPAASEAVAAATLAVAYATFAADAVAGVVSITAAGVGLGKAAMLSALVGMSTPGAGPAVITSAVQAFWVAVAAGLATSFAAATAITPPPHAGLQVLLEVAFVANTASRASLVDAAQAIATAMASQAIIGGTATFPGPIISPIT